MRQSKNADGKFLPIFSSLFFICGYRLERVKGFSSGCMVTHSFQATCKQRKLAWNFTELYRIRIGTKECPSRQGSIRFLETTV